MKARFFVLLYVSISAVYGQTGILSGSVLDAETGLPLPSASVRIIGTSKGTITNTEGQFRLTSSGPCRLAVSYLGYQSDTVDAGESHTRNFRILLTPNVIQLAAVTVTDEDPAYEIIRKAIASKQRWMSRLKTFEARAFNRMQIRSDSSIAAIIEGYSTLYYSNGDSLREVITQQKQTGNLPSSVSLSRVGEIMNFNDDRIRQNGYTFVGPTAPDAFSVYDFRLISTGRMDDYDLYEIEIVPRSAVVPLFKGRITIAEHSYAVMRVDVRPNEAFSQLFINTKDSRYTQVFRLFDDRYWLPVSYRFTATFRISVAGMSFPSFGLDRDVVIYDYSLNPVFADSIAHLQKLTVDSSAAVVDSLFWSANDVLPLDEEQKNAYRSLDSTQTLEKQFAPKGAGAALLSMSGGPVSYADVWFNRTEGLHLGISKSFGNVWEDVDLRGGAGYGFSDNTWKWEGGVTVRFGASVVSSVTGGFTSVGRQRRLFALDLDLYDHQIYFPEPLLPGLLLNSVAALLLKDDVQDYYRTVGGSMKFTVAAGERTIVSATVRSEQQLTVYQTTNYSFLKKDIPYALQPGIINGRMNALRFDAAHGSEGILALSKQGYLMKGSVEQSGGPLGGRFDFTQMKGKFRAKIATMLKEETVTPPALGFQITGGYSFGSVPPQRYVELYSKFETAAGYGTLKGLPRREMYGDQYLALTVDHNFRRTLFAPLGITSLMESNLDLIMEVNAARSWFSPRALRTPLFPSRDSGGWYYEASIGISNIADLLRFDITRRFSGKKDWAFSLTISEFLVGLLAP
jgi:hypothetical protein